MSNSNFEKVMNANDEPVKEDDGNDSDESISTEELNKLQSEVDEVFKKDKEEPKPIEIEQPKEDVSIDEPQIKPKKTKVKKLSKKELEEQKRLLEEQLKYYEDESDSLEVKPEPVKKRAGRPKKTEEQKEQERLSKKTIIKEKVIYMIPNDEGGYKEVKNAKPLSKLHLKKLEEEKKIQEKEQEIGKRIVRTKRGKEDKRSTRERTPAQIEHSKKLVAMMAQRRKDKKEKSMKEQKDTIKQAVVEVVSKPIEEVRRELPDYKPPVRSINQQYNDFFS